MSKFIGTNRQLINCLQIIADSRSSSQRDTAILIEAADRLRDATKERPALIAERDALREALRRIASGDSIGGPDAELQCANIAHAALAGQP